MTCVTDECTQGRKPCPTPDQCCERARRIQEEAHRWHCRDIGVEAALPASFTEIVTDEIKPKRSLWQRIGFATVVALCLLWAAIAVWG